MDFNLNQLNWIELDGFESIKFFLIETKVFYDFPQIFKSKENIKKSDCTKSRLLQNG